MRFAFTDEQAMIAQTAFAFFDEHATSARTRDAMATGDGTDRALWRDFTRQLGLAAVAVPEAYGGSGLGLVELAIVAEAAGRSVAALPLIASLGIAAPAIVAGGSDAQRGRWLPALAAGDAVATFAEAEGMGCDGDRLTGSAAHVPHATVADLIVVAAAERVFLVARDAAGLTVVPQATMDATRPLARVELRAVAAEPLDDAAAGLRAAYRTGWVAIAADALGGAQACLDRTVDYAKERTQFGRAIGSFQAVKHRLADMMVEIEQARSAVYWAACARDEDAADADFAAHAAKAFATDAYAMCAGNMIQLHGGIGFSWEHDAHLFFKRAQANRTLLRAPAWHRERIAALAGLDAAA